MGRDCIARLPANANSEEANPTTEGRRGLSVSDLKTDIGKNAHFL